MGSKMKVFTTN